MNYNNERLKTTGESIQYLNAIILGLSSTNGVIPKAYNSAYTIQERLTSLEEKGVPAAFLDEVNQALDDLDNAVGQLEAIVEQYLDDPTGWVQLTTLLDPDGNLYIKRIGKIINIQGYFEAKQHGYIITTLPAEFVPDRIVSLNVNADDIYIADIDPQTGNIVSHNPIPVDEWVSINVTYML